MLLKMLRDHLLATAKIKKPNFLYSFQNTSVILSLVDQVVKFIESTKYILIINVKFCMKYCCIILFPFTAIHCQSDSSLPPLTKANVQDFLSNSSRDQQLKQEVISGYVSVPATSFFQRVFVGSQATGESCTIAVRANNSVSVSFLRDQTFNLVEFQPYPLFVAELTGNQVLVVQHSFGKVVSVTQTIYDDNDHIVYQSSGKGEFIQSCILPQ